MRILTAIFVVFFLTSIAPACSCVKLGQSMEDEVKMNLDRAGAVFEGKAGEYLDQNGTDRLVLRFSVERLWKGDVAAEFELQTDTVRGTDRILSMNSCEYVFA